jgi:catechol 2,3-dioxygenase-like lactoylglutathione lyase family enzyme
MVVCRMTVGSSLTFAALIIAGWTAAEDLHSQFTGDIKPVVYVSDVARSMPFYRDVLGFDFDGFAGDPADPYYAEMLAGPVKFGLHEPTVPGDESRIGQQRLYFRVFDLNAQRRYVETRGVVVEEIIRRSWMDFFSVRDLDGNTIVFAVTDLERHTSEPWRRDSAD